jgi:predicted CopG family antitoxin
MPMIRVTEKTHERLVGMKRGADTLDDVVTRLIERADDRGSLLIKEEHDRQAMEAARATSRRSSRRQ